MQSLNGPSSLMGYVIGGGPGRGGVALVLGVFVAVFASACGDGGDQTGTGGTGGAGGAGGRVKADSGAGGAVPVECQAAVYTHTSTFTSTFDGWGVPQNNPTPTLVPIPGEDGGPPSGTVQSLDAQVGSPTPGSAKLEVPFSGAGEQLLFAQNYPTPLNLGGSMVTAQINVESGLIGDPVTSVVQAFVVLKSTSAYTYATGPAVNLEPGAGWMTVSIDADAPPGLPQGHNPCDVREIDIEVRTGMAGTYRPGVVRIDTIAIVPRGG
jgi:hypothetical protein